MQSLEFKIQPTVMVFTAFNHCSRPVWLNRVEKVMFVCCDLADFNPLLVSIFLWSVGCRCNYDSQQCFIERRSK